MKICYLVLVTRTPGFTDHAATEHVRFLDEVRVRDQLLITGSFTDKTGGAYVLHNVADRTAAQAIVDADPLLVLGSATATVHEWSTR
ncbi:YciI family protein [Stenotrophomonas sp. VV52]|uniref:YciI family protein n=1 Tax=Stenotrophomonas sp. VV52 TaxID=2066958 RepID=UPI000C9E7092|nr:YciI family protein [Stenotrophomonas sp. VV52]